MQDPSFLEKSFLGKQQLIAVWVGNKLSIQRARYAN